MGFVNSVAVAQHLHRRLVMRALDGRVSASQEIRRDKELPLSPLFYRTYLDNFDVLSLKSKQLLESEETEPYRAVAENLPGTERA